MKLADVERCVKRCSADTQTAYDLAKDLTIIEVDVADRERVTVAAIVARTIGVEGVWGRAEVRRISQKVYRLFDREGVVPGFSEQTLVEFGKACICAVRQNHKRG